MKMKTSVVARYSMLAGLALAVTAACSDEDAVNEPGAHAGSSGKGHVDPGGAGGDGSGGDGGQVGGGGHGPRDTPPSCTTPQHDAVTGLTTCAEGYRYRGEATVCAKRQGERPAGNEGGAGAGGGGGSAGEGGVGSTLEGGAGGAGEGEELRCFPACDAGEFCRVVSATPYATACSVGCLSDDECGANQLCACDGPRGGVCVEADCRGDSDCADGYHCAQAEGCYADGGKFVCQSSEDECVTRADCDHVMCSPDGDHRTCSKKSCG